MSSKKSSKKNPKKASEKASKEPSEAKLEEFVESQLSCLKMEEAAENRKKSFKHVLTAQAFDSFDPSVESFMK